MECESQTENQYDRIKLLLMLFLNKFCERSLFSQQFIPNFSP